MERPLLVTAALALPENLSQRLRDLDPRIQLVVLSRAQRNLYRGSRSIWVAYGEPSEPEAESEEEARQRLEAILAETEVLFTTPLIRADVTSLAPRLRWVQLTSAGVDRLLESPLLRSGITITTASGIHSVPIGEYVIGAMLALAKGFPRAMRAQAQAAWQPYTAEELQGKTVGIIGLGAIGGHVATLAHALGLRVLAIRRSASGRERGQAMGDPRVDELLPPSDLPRLLSESDYVVITVPLTPETRGMIGEGELRRMKPTAVLINIARGAIVDEVALVRALREGWIGGAALDVFEREPLPPESPLWGMENVLVTPHIAGGTPRYLELAVDLFCDNLRRYLAGQPLRNVVDVARGY